MPPKRASLGASDAEARQEFQSKRESANIQIANKVQLLPAHPAAESPDFQKSSLPLACSASALNLKLEREDWALFRTIEGLQQKAGVAQHLLRRLVLKELADNALDEARDVRVGEHGEGYFV